MVLPCYLLGEVKLNTVEITETASEEKQVIKIDLYANE